METLADYGTVAYFGVPTLSTGIYRTWFGLGDRLAAAQLAGVLLVAMVALLWVERRARQQRRIAGADGPPAPPRVLTRARGLPLAALLWLPVVFGFLLPALQLAAWSLPRWRGLLAPDFLRLLGTSLLIAGCTRRRPPPWACCWCGPGACTPTARAGWRRAWPDSATRCRAPCWRWAW